MHQRAKRQGAVGAAAGDHDIGPAIKRGLDRKRAQIGIRGEHPPRQGGARDRLGHAGRAQAVDHGDQIIALAHGDAGTKT